MIGCLVISHGSIAQSLVDASEKIAGKCDFLHCLSSDGITLNLLKSKIQDLIRKEQFDDGLVLLVSLQGGSGWNVSRAVANGNDNIALISGTNLPMLLSFITKRNQYAFRELVKVIIDDGLRGIDHSDFTINTPKVAGAVS